MIKLTRLNQTEIIVNADLIEFVEQTPDTVLTLITGRKVLVRETAEDIVQRVIAYRQVAGSLQSGSVLTGPSGAGLELRSA